MVKGYISITKEMLKYYILNNIILKKQVLCDIYIFFEIILTYLTNVMENCFLIDTTDKCNFC